jgi:hypothetical protein
MTAAEARQLVADFGLEAAVKQVVADAPEPSAAQRETLKTIFAPLNEAIFVPLNVMNADPDSRRSSKPGDVTSDASAE